MMLFLTEAVTFSLFALCSGRQGFGPGQQDWGYITVRPAAHMFWWLYYTTADVENYKERPLIIWLQGGPGASSTGYGNFAEIGPLDLNLEVRNNTWVKNANVLFVDNPVGSGFSYVKSSDVLCKNNTQIADDLVEFMKQFYETFADFKTVPLYIFGQSYGGKVAVEFALNLHKEVEGGKIESNLKGIALGNSWVSPIDSVVGWAPFLFHMGVLDRHGMEKLSEIANLTQDYWRKGDFVEATEYSQKTMLLLLKLSYGVDMYNVLKQSKNDDIRLEKIMNIEVKKALNVSSVWKSFNMKVYSALYKDFMKPVTNLVEELLNTTSLKIFVYNGQLDVIVETLGTVKWIDNLKWKDKELYESAARRDVEWNGQLEGYVKSTDNFAMYWINRAGHSAPAENPMALEVLLRSLTDNYKGVETKKPL